MDLKYNSNVSNKIPVKYDDILKYIVYKCRESNSPIAESLIAYLLRITYNNNKDTFYFNYINDYKDILSKDDAVNLINKINNILQTHKDGSLETLMLQIKIEIAYNNENIKYENFKSFFVNELNTITEDIKKFAQNKDKDYNTINLYKKIFSYLLVKTKQYTYASFDENFKNKDLSQINSNNYSDSKYLTTEKEIYSAFDNVLPKSGLPPFISLPPQKKSEQLIELSNIVFGIRLLNKELGKGGAGLMSLSEIKQNHNRKLYDEINDKHRIVSDLCKNYSNLYELIDFSLLIDEYHISLYDRLRKYIVYFQQVIIILSNLKNELIESHLKVEELSSYYSKEIQYLLDLVEKKSALSKEQVYPRFESLTNIYNKFQEQFFVLNIKKNVYNSLINFLNASTIPTNESDSSEFIDLNDFLKSKTTVNNQNINEEVIGNDGAGMYKNGVTVILPESSPDFMDIKLDYQGFCIVSIINKEGLLVTGKPNVVVKYKEKYLVFNTNSAFQEFLYEPDRFINSIKNYVMKHSYLINLLNMSEEFPNSNLTNLLNIDNTYSNSSALTVDSSCQTDIHPEENSKFLKNKSNDYNLNNKYVWNEWELKKQALQLADIMNKKTVSCQTDLSHFRKEKETQIYPLQETGVNTIVSKGTNLSIPRNYVYGLRRYSNSYIDKD